MALRCWKHSRQNTGRPCVGRKGTVVSFPHCEQFVFVSERIGEACPPPPPPSALFALQALHRLGSFLKPLSAKNICSPPVNTNSAPHSAHFSTLSWYSMSRSPLVPCGQEMGRTLHQRAEMLEETCIRGRRARIPWACGHEAETRTQNFPALRGPDSRKCGAKPRGKRIGGPNCWGAAFLNLIRFPPLLLAQSLPRKRFLGPALLAGFHVEAVLLDFLDDVFLLHLALETPQGIFQGFTLLDDDFSHFINSPPIRFGLVSCGTSRRPCCGRL